MMRLKFLVVALAIGAGATSAYAASGIDSAPANGLTLYVDWQVPSSLPPRFRNHCSAENFTGRPYCSDHCGSDYQVFYCSEGSFGCCRLGHGYCDFNGLLRCSP
jgi:hypothetical protein